MTLPVPPDCCELAVIVEGGQVEGDPPVVVAIRLVTQATPMLSAASIVFAGDDPQVVPSATWTQIEFGAATPGDGVTALPDGMWSASFPNRLTALFSGYYRLTLTVPFTSTTLESSEQAVAQIRVTIPPSLGTQISNMISPNGNSSFGNTLVVFVDFVTLAAGDYIEAWFRTGWAFGAVLGNATDPDQVPILSMVMLAPYNVLAGPTGICNQLSNVLASAATPTLCVENPTTCYCPSQDFGRARSLTVDFRASGRGQFPRARSLTAETVYNPSHLIPAYLPRARSLTAVTSHATAMSADLPRARSLTAESSYTPGASFPVYKSNAHVSPTTNVTGVIVTPPSGTVATDLLVGLLVLTNTSTTPTISGWSLWNDKADFAAACKLWAYWRIADGTTADDFSPTFSNCGAIAAVLRIDFASTSQSGAANAVTDPPSSTTPAAAVSSPTGTNTLVLRVAAKPNQSGTLTAPSGTTSIVTVIGGNVFNLMLTACWEDQALSGANTARNFAVSPALTTAMFTVSVKP